MSNAEVAVILANEALTIKAQGREPNGTFEKTHVYVKRFCGLSDPTNSQAALDQLRE